MRLIDADEFKRYIKDGFEEYKDEIPLLPKYREFSDELTKAFLMDIDEQKTIEAVKVVRCKDCVENDAKYGNEENWCLKFGYTMHDDDFCSYGERETNEYSK